MVDNKRKDLEIVAQHVRDGTAVKHTRFRSIFTIGVILQARSSLWWIRCLPSRTF